MQIDKKKTTYDNGQESGTSETQAETSDFLEGNGKGKEQEVENSVEEGEVKGEQEHDGLEEHEDKGSDESNLERFG